MQPGRRVAAVTDRDARIRAEYASGREVPDIAARYDVPVAYVDRVIEDAVTPPPQPAVSRWSLSNQGNRVFLALLIGWLAWMATGRITVWTLVVIALIAYAVTSAVVSLRRR